MSEFTDLLEKALPTIETYPEPKRQAINEAMQRMVDVKQLELDAQRRLLTALQQTYTYWNFVPKRSWGPVGRNHNLLVVGYSAEDAMTRVPDAAKWFLPPTPVTDSED